MNLQNIIRLGLTLGVLLFLLTTLIICSVNNKEDNNSKNLLNIEYIRK